MRQKYLVLFCPLNFDLKMSNNFFPHSYDWNLPIAPSLSQQTNSINSISQIDLRSRIYHPCPVYLPGEISSNPQCCATQKPALRPYIVLPSVGETCSQWRTNSILCTAMFCKWLSVLSSRSHGGPRCSSFVSFSVEIALARGKFRRTLEVEFHVLDCEVRYW